MANRHRGEIEARFDGKPYKLCLTLGALADLEDRLNVDGLGELVARLGRGTLSSREILAVLTCGLQGAGYTLTLEEVAEMQVDGGLTGYARIATDLLSATFASVENG